MPRRTEKTTLDEKLAKLRGNWQEKRKKHLIAYSLSQNTQKMAEETNAFQQVEHCCCCGNYSVYWSVEVECRTCDLRYPCGSLLEFMEILQSNLYQHQSVCNGQVLFSFHKETGLFMACSDCDEISFI
jgi:hypothetical protein